MSNYFLSHFTPAHLEQPFNPEDGKANLRASCCDVVQWALFDQITLAPSAKPYQAHMFKHPRFCGGAHAPRPENETNMWESGRLPAPMQFKVERIYFIAASKLTTGDKRLLYSKVMWKLWIGQKPYAEGHLELADHHTRSYVLKDDGSPTGLVPATAIFLEHPFSLLILDGQSFNIQLTIDNKLTLNHPVTFHCFLDGLLARGVM